MHNMQNSPYLPAREGSHFNIWDSRFVNMYECLTRCIHGHECDCHNWTVINAELMVSAHPASTQTIKTEKHKSPIRVPFPAIDPPALFWKHDFDVCCFWKKIDGIISFPRGCGGAGPRAGFWKESNWRNSQFWLVITAYEKMSLSRRRIVFRVVIFDKYKGTNK